jgi:hypothetical protein
MQDINPREEACFNYAMSDGSAYNEFLCACGEANCRGRVTGDDWRRSELWVRCTGFFSPYLERQISGLQEQALFAKTALDQRSQASQAISTYPG